MSNLVRFYLSPDQTLNY